jgi:gamma-glutamylcyclotransferase (GGCT)/AIG2-like uncharacterized protein YtfP
VSGKVNEVPTRVVIELVDTANAARRRSRVDDDAESQLDSLFGTGDRLAVYGSLAPGRQNHHIVVPLGGTWTQGIVNGDLVTCGWGAAVGYPALYLRERGPAVPVHVLASDALRRTWPELDSFEGVEYCRVLAAVWSDDSPQRELVSVANVYEAATAAP